MKKVSDSNLAKARQLVRSKFGDEAIVSIESTKIDILETGILLLDLALGVGGWPKGRLIELFGMPLSGKSTLSLVTANKCQQEGNPVLYFDYEHSFDPDYAQKLGVNFDNKLWILSQPATMEEGLSIAEIFIEQEAVGLVIFDSLAAMTPKKILDGDFGDSHVAIQAKLMAEALQRLTHKISRSNTIVLFINHIRDVISTIPTRVPRKTTPGGNALKFYSSVRVELQQIESIAGKIDDPITGRTIDAPVAVKVKAVVVKNKVATPYRTALFYLDSKYGISDERTIFDIAESRGLITRNGPRVNLPFKSKGKTSLSFSGTNSAISWLQSNQDKYKILRNKVISIMGRTDVEPKKLSNSAMEVSIGSED